MTAPFRIEMSEPNLIRSHYEGRTQDALRTVWRRKWLIGMMVAGSLVLGAMALVLIGPRYTGEAIIQVNFIRDEPATGTKVQPIANIDAAALVDGAARVVRSHANASAVVTRLGLDKDPEFTHESISWRLFSALRGALGLRGVKPTPHDVAVNTLMRRVAVTNDPRSYLISVAITMSDPQRAAQLANAVAVEYMRGQMLQQLIDQEASVEGELGQLTSMYGSLHPSILLARARLEKLQARLKSLREQPLKEDAVDSVAGQSFVAAQEVMVPSGPNIILILGLAIGGALLGGIWLALMFPPATPMRSAKLAIVGDQQLEPFCERAAE